MTGGLRGGRLRWESVRVHWMVSAPRSWGAVLTLALLSAAGVSGCRTRGAPETGYAVAPNSGDEVVITQANIEGQGTRTVWEVVKRWIPNLSYQEDRNGRPVRIWRHGRGSIVLNENPLLFVDGVRVSDIGALDDIPAAQVDTIWVLTGLAATTTYGTNAASGVVLVRTRRGP